MAYNVMMIGLLVMDHGVYYMISDYLLYYLCQEIFIDYSINQIL